MYVKMISRCLLAVLFTAMSGAELRAQVKPVRVLYDRDTTMVELMSKIRSGEGSYMLDAILIQRIGGPEDQRRRDALADSLVAVTLEYRRDGGSGDDAPMKKAISALGAAGRGTDGIAFLGAYERLEKLVEDAEVGLGASALATLSSLPDTARVLSYLHKTAKRDDPMSHTAIMLLFGHHGSAGLEVLHDLYRNDLVSYSRAQLSLMGIARDQEW